MEDRKPDNQPPMSNLQDVLGRNNANRGNAAQMQGTDSNDSADEGAFAVASKNAYKNRINSGDSQGNEKAPAKRSNPIQLGLENSGGPEEMDDGGYNQSKKEKKEKKDKKHKKKHKKHKKEKKSSHHGEADDL